MELKGSVVLVTGGAKGLGLAIALHLQTLGALVIVADLDESALADLPKTMKTFILDVTQPDKVKIVIGQIIDQYGHIDALVNNAGVIYSQPMVNIMNPDKMMHDYEQFRKSITANLDSVFIVSSAVLEHMVRQRIKGAIVNISSISACGNEGQSAYSAAKAGVNALTVAWSKELGRIGIRCNAVAPGFIETDSTHNALHESVIKYIQKNTPLRRLGQPNEIAQAVAFIISNDFINGVVLPVNGGLTI